MDALKTTEAALKQLTNLRRYQIMIFIIIGIFDSFPSIMHMNVTTFLGYTQKHRCAMNFTDTVYNAPHYNESRYLQLGLDSSCKLLKNVPIEVLSGKLNQRPFLHANDSKKEEYGNAISCKYGWVYDKSFINTSTTSDWDLVCDYNMLPEVSQAIFNIGVMIGAFMFGSLADMFGRKKIFIICLVCQSLCGSIAYFSSSYIQFVILRAVVGCLEQGVNIVGFILAIELFVHKERSVFAISHEYMWAIGGCILSVLAYFIRDWRVLQLSISAPWIISISLIWILPESIVWLISKNKLKEVDVILQKGSNLYKKSPLPVDYSILNNVHKLPTLVVDTDQPSPNLSLLIINDLQQDNQKDILENIELNGNSNQENCHVQLASAENNKNKNIFHLFKTPKIRTITICVCALWLLNTACYYGWAYNTPNLHGNMYLNFFIAHIIEIPSCILTLFCITKFGRIKSLIFFHLIGGVVCIISVFIPENINGYDSKWLQVTLALLGKFAFNSSYTIIYIYSPEIYPTCLRTTGSGIASMSGRIGGIIYPYINYLSKVKVAGVGNQLPLIIFGLMSLIATFFAIPLPETNNNPLPSTVHDVENYQEFAKKHRMTEEEK